MAEGVLTGALAIIKVKGQPVGLMRNISINENSRRQLIRGLGSILPKEGPVIEWAGTVTCSFFEINYTKSGVKDAIRRDVGFGNTASNIASGNNASNFEDNLLLDDVGVQLDIYKKITDVIDPNTQLIVPKLKPYATISRCLIESDSINIDEGSVSGRNQTFSYLDPVVRDPGQ